MSDLITTAQDTFRDAGIATYVHARSAVHTLVDRVKEERGQTAAEYMGVLLLIAAIITAIVVSPIGEKISTALGDQVDKISGIDVPASGPAAPKKP